MTAEDAAFHAQWHVASGHPKGWRVCRQFFAPWQHAAKGAPNFQEAKGPAGRVRLFRSASSAAVAARQLNAITPEVEGLAAQRAGVKWWVNPYLSGSKDASRWDAGHTQGRKQS